MTGHVRWLGEQRMDGRLVARIGRTESECIAEFPGLAVLRANRAGTHHVLTPLPGADSSLVEKLDRSAVTALLRHLQGKITLHAGAVSQGGRAVALLGRSGSGKSTLVAHWCTSGEAFLMADDTAALEVIHDDRGRSIVHVLPADRTAWLHEPSRRWLRLQPGASGKVAVAMDRAETSARPLAAFVALVFTDGVDRPELRSLRGQNAFAALSTSMVRFIIDEPSMQKREFDQMQQLVDHCPMFELRRPKSLEHADACLELLKPLLADEGGRTS